jgi:hypothetical protein
VLHVLPAEPLVAGANHQHTYCSIPSHKVGGLQADWLHQQPVATVVKLRLLACKKFARWQNPEVHLSSHQRTAAVPTTCSNHSTTLSFWLQCCLAQGNHHVGRP